MEYLERIDYTAQGFGERYDELPLWSAPFGLMLLERVPLESHATILDVGSGTGWLSIELAERCGPGATVVAVDPWKAGMDRLRRKVAWLGLQNVVFLEQDAAAIDVSDGSVDLIVSNLGINNFDDAAAVLAACFRVARSGATIGLTTNLVGHMEELYHVYRETLVELGQRDRLVVLDAHVAHRGTTDSVVRSLQDVGFEVVDIARDAFHMRFASGSALLRHHFIRLGFVQGWASIPAVGSVERTFDRFERNLNALARRRGALSLTIPMACVLARKPAAG